MSVLRVAPPDSLSFRVLQSDGSSLVSYELYIAVRATLRSNQTVSILLVPLSWPPCITCEQNLRVQLLISFNHFFFSFFLAGAQHAQFLHVSAVTVALQLAACSCSCCSRPRADGCKREGDKNNSNECSHVNSSVSVHWHIMWWGETLYMHGWKQEVFTVFLYFNGLLACM